MKKTLINKIGKSLLISTAAFILCVLQCYIAMKQFANNPSADCLNCSFFEEVVFWSIPIFVLMLPIAYFVFSKSKTTSHVMLAFLIIGYIAFCAFWTNHAIFIAREAAWSTYTLSEQLHRVLIVKGWTILLSATVFCYLVWLIKNKNSKIKTQ
jgi:hypothetical protein